MNDQTITLGKLMKKYITLLCVCAGLQMIGTLGAKNDC